MIRPVLACHKPLVLAAAFLLLCGSMAHGQTATCTVAPEPPSQVESKVDPPIKATAKAAFTPAVLTLGWKAPNIDRASQGNAPLAYVIEVGSNSGLSDITIVKIAGAERSYVAPLANGTYYVRLRSENGCGTGRPSKESRVRASNSVEKGLPNPLVILNTIHGTRETLGNKAYARVVGQVRNGWLASPAPFVKVSATFEGARGELGRSDAVFVNGTSRRLKHSRIVTDTVLEPGATGCFLIFGEFSLDQVTGLGLVASADAFETEMLKGDVVLDGIMATPDEFGSLVVKGRMKNAGGQPTVFNELWVETSDETGQVVDCHGTSVHGSSLVLDEGLNTQTGLPPAGGGEFAGTTEAVFAQARAVRNWISWDEAETQGAPALTSEYRALKKRLVALLEGDEQATSSQELVRARDALRSEALSIEQRLATASR